VISSISLFANHSNKSVEEDLDHLMNVIVQHPVPDPHLLEDRHLLDREVHTVDVPEVLIVEMIELQLAQVLRTGDVDHPLRLLAIQNIHLVEPLETRPDVLHPQSTQTECILHKHRLVIPDLDHHLHETILLQDLPIEIGIQRDLLLETLLESALLSGPSFQDHLHVVQPASDRRRLDQAAAVILQHLQALQHLQRPLSRSLPTTDKIIQAL
jgi:hypothetical protein